MGHDPQAEYHHVTHPPLHTLTRTHTWGLDEVSPDGNLHRHPLLSQRQRLLLPLQLQAGPGQIAAGGGPPHMVGWGVLCGKAPDVAGGTAASSLPAAHATAHSEGSTLLTPHRPTRPPAHPPATTRQHPPGRAPALPCGPHSGKPPQGESAAAAHPPPPAQPGAPAVNRQGAIVGAKGGGAGGIVSRQRRQLRRRPAPPSGHPRGGRLAAHGCLWASNSP